MIVTCYIHKNKRMPREMAHEHHIIPRAAAGSNDPSNLAFVCPDCHHAIHQLAIMLVNNRQGDLLSAAHTMYPAPAERKRVLELASTVAEGIIAKQEGEITTDHLIAITLDHATFLAAKRVANDFRHAGRRVGVAKFMQALLIQELRRRGMRVSNIVL